MQLDQFTCRTCLKKFYKNEKLFDYDFIDPISKIPLITKLKIFMNVKSEEASEFKMCMRCYQLLNSAHLLYSLCLTSEITLRKSDPNNRSDHFRVLLTLEEIDPAVKKTKLSKTSPPLELTLDKDTIQPPTTVDELLPESSAPLVVENIQQNVDEINKETDDANKDSEADKGTPSSSTTEEELIKEKPKPRRGRSAKKKMPNKINDISLVCLKCKAKFDKVDDLNNHKITTCTKDGGSKLSCQITTDSQNIEENSTDKDGCMDKNTQPEKGEQLHLHKEDNVKEKDQLRLEKTAIMEGVQKTMSTDEIRNADVQDAMVIEEPPEKTTTKKRKVGKQVQEKTPKDTPSKETRKSSNDVHVTADFDYVDITSEANGPTSRKRLRSKESKTAEDSEAEKKRKFLEKLRRDFVSKSSPLVKNKYECSTCAISFRSKAILDSHIKLHGTIFKCTYCDSKFLIRKALDEHVKWHIID